MIKMMLDAEVPLEEYTDVCSFEPRVYYNMIRLEKLMKALAVKAKSREVQLCSFLYNYVGFRPRDLNRSIIEKLFDAAYVPHNYFITKAEGFTHTKDTKLQMIEAGILEDFNSLHLNLTSINTEYSKIVKVIQRSYCRNKVEGNNGPLVEIPFTILPTRNRRFTTSDENVIGMHKVINPSMEARKGYVLVQGDFPQIDGRGALNIYFKSGFTNDLMLALDDSYLVYKEIARWFPYLKAKDEFDIAMKSENPVDTVAQENIISKFQTEVIPFLHRPHRDLYKVIALRTVYNSSSSPLLSEDREIKKLSAAINAMPVYAATRHYALYLKKVGYPVIVKSLFGYERQIMENAEFTFLAQIFNSPIQATSSEIIMYVIMKIINYFRDLGYNEDSVRLYLNRHDEPIFEIKEEVFIEHADFFNDVSWVSVQGWKPFKIDWMVSHSYGVPLDDYTKLVNTVNECPDPTIEEAPQFFPLAMPRIMAFKKMELVDDRVILLLSEFTGEFPEDGFCFGKFKDKRTIEFTAKISKLEGTIADNNYILSIINLMLAKIEGVEPFLIYVEGTSSLTHLTMGERDVWITGETNDLDVINNCIMASIVNQLDPSLMNADLNYWLNHSRKLQGRLKKR